MKYHQTYILVRDVKSKQLVKKLTRTYAREVIQGCSNLNTTSPSGVERQTHIFYLVKENHSWYWVELMSGMMVSRDFMKTKKIAQENSYEYLCEVSKWIDEHLDIYFKSCDLLREAKEVKYED